MRRELRVSDDPGTILESVAFPSDAGEVRSAEPPDGTRLEPSPFGHDARAVGRAIAETVYRPTIRPLVPRLTLLDDGDLGAGEVVRLREPLTLIGRTEGQIRLPHDPLVSGRHAELVREGATRPHRWLLRDLGSSNGTFARCTRTLLRDAAILILGGRRFRFHSPQATPQPAGHENATVAFEVARPQLGSSATLVETGVAEGGLVLSLNGPDISLGRPGHGNDIEIDDPLLAPRHARLRRDHAGRWTLEALPSVNGVWAQITTVSLTNRCRFQIGEQRFLFVLDDA